MKRMMLKGAAILGTLALLLVGVSTALAGSFKFSGTFKLGSLIAQGYLSGIGNTDVSMELIAHGTTRAYCQNKGGTQAPGRNPINIQLTATGLFQTDQNGRVFVSLETANPNLSDLAVSPTPKTAGCPNGNWTVVGLSKDVNWTGADIVGSKQADGSVVVSQTYTCTTTFGTADNNNDGVPDATGVSCSLVSSK